MRFLFFLGFYLCNVAFENGRLRQLLEPAQQFSLPVLLSSHLGLNEVELGLSVRLERLQLADRLFMVVTFTQAGEVLHELINVVPQVPVACIHIVLIISLHFGVIQINLVNASVHLAVV